MSPIEVTTDHDRNLVATFFEELAEAVRDCLAPKFSGEHEMVMNFTFNRRNQDKNMRIIIRPETKKVELYTMRGT